MEKLKLQKHNLTTRMKQTIERGTFSWHALLSKIGLGVKTPVGDTHLLEFRKLIVSLESLQGGLL